MQPYPEARGPLASTGGRDDRGRPGRLPQPAV